MIELTVAAAGCIQALLLEEGAVGYGLRIQVVGGGCSGLYYDLELVPGPEPEEESTASRGVSIFVDRRALPIIRGLVVDYRDGFRFTNPNAHATCRCGASFR